MTRVKEVEQKAPKFQLYVVGTLILVFVGYISSLLYGVLITTGVEGNLAPAQFGQQGASANALSRGLAAFDGQGWIWVVTATTIFLLWWRFGTKAYAFHSAKVVGILLLIVTFSGCGPAKLEDFDDVEDHETSFLIPMEGQTESQEKFNSKDFLQQNLIAAKRVSLPLRKKYTGRMPWDYEWIPTARLITVERTPKHREWINLEGNKQGQVLRAQSSEGIKFTTGAVISALVTEDDAALFRSHFKNVPLDTILDTTVRGYAQERLAAEFGAISLDKCQTNKSVVFSKVEKETIDEFRKVGITVLYFGNHGGLAYLNDKVQQAIDSEYLQKLDKQISEKKLVAQLTRNDTQNIQAKAEAAAAGKLQEAAEAMQFVTSVEIAKMQAQARLDMAKKVTGKLPETILPSEGNNQLLMEVK